jgi:ubiquinone/menaquinone biosynthesis C-methylase UbiE
MTESNVQTQMRAEWNERAREDANYFVAFGRRDQDDEEFFSTATDLIRELETELKRLPASAPGERRALEIGCGPGRLLRPMSRHFAEIHGIDVSDEMIAKAKEKLRNTPNAFPHHASGSDLSQFPDNHFDFVYSYAVFQHIPSGDVVFSYLRETVRVLKPGGVARLHINGLPKTSKSYTTWEGVRISSEEIHAFAREHNIRLLSLTGAETQYMWTTWQKPAAVRIRSLTNAFSSEQAVPASGRMACVALTIEDLPEACDLNSLTALIDGVPGTICYIGPRGNNGLSQVNVFLPKSVRTGLLPVRLELFGQRLCPDAFVRVIPPGPAVPRLTALSDAINLLSPQLIESNLIKVTMEEVDDIGTFHATVDSMPVHNVETFRTDPLAERWEVNFRVPDLSKGGHVLEVSLGKRLLARMGILLALALSSLFAADPTEAQLRKAFEAKTGVITLPAGEILVSREILLAPDVHDLEIRGANTTIKASDTFRGRALLVLTAGRNIKIHDLALDGNRDTTGRMMALPPAGTLYSRALPGNGIVAESVTGLEIYNVKAHHIPTFALLLNNSHNIKLHDVEVSDSGGFSPQRRNNATGGIALEENTTDFEIRHCRFGGLRGTGITLRATDRGRLTDNEFAVIARDGIRIQDSKNITVDANQIRQIGFPAEELDGRATCITLDHVTSSELRGNTCAETLLGAVVLQGSGIKVNGNQMTALNIAHQNTSGIYLEPGTLNVTIEGNVISGSGMGNHCVGAAPTVDLKSSRILKNDCSDEASVALASPAPWSSPPSPRATLR